MKKPQRTSRRHRFVRLLDIAAVALALGASSARAQTPRPAPPAPEVYDPPPASPIDGGKRSDSDKQIEAVVEPSPPPSPRGVGTIWMGWTVGSGYGWHPSQELETESRLKAGAAFGAGTIGQFGPEVGYQWRDRIALSAQTRHQIIPKVVSDPTRGGKPNQWAHSLILRATYLFPRERYQPYLGGVLGGGSGFRFRIDPQPSNNLPTSDTVRGGPLVLGPVAGIVFPLVNRLHLVGELRALLGAPDLATLAEVNFGLQFDL